MESHTETVLSWEWVVEEPSSPLQMEPLGITGLLVQQTISVESPTETDSS